MIVEIYITCFVTPSPTFWSRQVVHSQSEKIPTQKIETEFVRNSLSEVNLIEAIYHRNISSNIE